MPKRVIDFDAMWGSDKLASCVEWAQAEYAWLYGLADASGCFELTNLRVIWGRVAAIRHNLTIDRLEQILDEFQDKGLLFVWEHEGKRYGHWTGSDVPGRLPPPSWRMRLERLAPPVPKQKFAEYVSRFARGRAAMAGGGFRGETERNVQNNQFEISNLKSQNSPAASGSTDWRTEQFEISDLKSQNLQTTVSRSDRENDQFEISDLKSQNLQAASGRAGGGKQQHSDSLYSDGLSFPRTGEQGRPAAEPLFENLKSNQSPRGTNAGDGESGECAIAPAGGLHSLKGSLEEDQAQDLNWEWELEGKENRNAARSRVAGGKALNGRAELLQTPNTFPPVNSKLNSNLNSHLNSNPHPDPHSDTPSAERFEKPPQSGANRVARGAAAGVAPAAGAFPMRDKALLAARELAVGRGPSCGPVKVKLEALERIRARDAARAGSRSP